jgi:16S rRNA (uracil1498-N3)-methyltransferase
MRLHRFYVSQPLGEEVVIEDVSTIKQWLKVFRYRKDDFVILFNGDGYNYTYALTNVSHSSCTLILSKKELSYIPDKKVYLCIALIKKDLFELVAEKATELCVTDIIPLFTERTEKKNINEERVHSILKEASEQSGRGDVPVLHDTHTLREAITFLSTQMVSAENTYPATLFGTEYKEIFFKNRLHPLHDSPVAFFVGPEGGWTPAEEELFKEKGFTCVSLGKTTLRAETAGITCVLLSNII